MRYFLCSTTWHAFTGSDPISWVGKKAPIPARELETPEEAIAACAMKGDGWFVVEAQDDMEQNRLIFDYGQQQDDHWIETSFFFGRYLDWSLMKQREKTHA